MNAKQETEKPLWSDKRTEEDCDEIDRYTVIYNLYEDIRCLKEELEALETRIEIISGDAMTFEHDLKATERKLADEKDNHAITVALLGSCTQGFEKMERKLAKAEKVYKTEDWNEDYGDCVFFHFYNFDEPPAVCCNSPLDYNFDESKWTHFIRINFNNIFDQVSDYEASKEKL